MGEASTARVVAEACVTMVWKKKGGIRAAPQGAALLHSFYCPLSTFMIVYIPLQKRFFFIRFFIF
jgi:hypothetical protein